MYSSETGEFVSVCPRFRPNHVSNVLSVLERRPTSLDPVERRVGMGVWVPRDVLGYLVNSGRSGLDASIEFVRVKAILMESLAHRFARC